MYLKNLIVKWYIEVAKSYIFGVKVTNLFLKRAAMLMVSTHDYKMSYTMDSIDVDSWDHICQYMSVHRINNTELYHMLNMMQIIIIIMDIYSVENLPSNI